MRNPRYMEMNWREVSSQKSVVGADFSQGNIDFNWSVAHPASFIPAYSFGKIGLDMSTAVPAPPTIGDNIAYAENCANNLFGNTSLKVNGQDLSSIVSFSPQANMLKTRCSKTGAFLEHVAKYSRMINSSFIERRNLVSTDGQNARDDDLDYVTKTPYIDVPFQPGALGIWDYADVMCPGDYTLSLNPATNMYFALQGNPKRVAADGNPVAAHINVRYIKFYICTVKLTEQIPRQLWVFNFAEILIQAKPLGIAAPGGSASFDFTVPASTISLAFFIQSSDNGVPLAASPTVPRRVSLSMFKATNTTDANRQNVDDLSITQYQLTYANQTKPSTSWSAEYVEGLAAGNVPGRNCLQGRYETNLIENGLIRSEGGAESFDDFLRRGFYAIHSFVRDANDKSTQVTLNVTYGALTGARHQIYLAAIFNRQTECVVQDGRVQSVRGLNV